MTLKHFELYLKHSSESNIASYISLLFMLSFSLHLPRLSLSSHAFCQNLGIAELSTCPPDKEKSLPGRIHLVPHSTSRWTHEPIRTQVLSGDLGLSLVLWNQGPDQMNPKSPFSESRKQSAKFLREKLVVYV